MRYKEWETAFVRCTECGSYVDLDSMICKRCGKDCSVKEIKNAKSTNAKTREYSKKHY